MTMKLLSQQKVRRITFKYDDPPLLPKQVVTTSTDAYRIFLPHFIPHMHAFEATRVLLLNNAMRVKGVVTVARGGINGCIIDSRIIFGIAVATLSSAIIVAHNHPSGELKPSSDDITVTRQIVAGGHTLNLRVRDHLILAEDGFLSMQDEGLM